MKLARRDFLRLTAGAAVLPVLPGIAQAEAYPSKPVRIFIGFAPGSSSDIIVRLVAQRLSERLGQSFVVENRPGAGSTLATEAAVRAPPDGYTLMFCGSSNTITATLYENLKYDLVRDVAPVACLDRGPLVLVVHPSFPAKTVPEFISYAKANPGKISFGSAGIGTVAHLAPELFKMMAGVDMVHVPYKGLAPAMTDLIGGRLQAIFATMPPSIAHIKAGRLRALAVTSASRSAALPDLPAIGDFLPGYEATVFDGLGAPKNTPAEIVERLNKEINAALVDPGFTSHLADLGTVPTPMTSADFGKLLADETKKWAKVIRVANIKMN
jgi:tripartite-type tricarboxylate transporter receptor subunit TctC